jgi:hypothetical protein
MIYFAQRPSGGPVRTGILTGPATQSDDCRTELDPSFRMLAVVEGGIEEWRALLRRFSHLKVGGDWLRPGPDLLDFIAREGTYRESAERRETIPGCPGSVG